MKNFKIAFILVTSLFFLWGLSYGLLDVMNKNFQTHLGITKANSGLLQTAYFGAYFVMALPAGWIANRFSYKVGIIVGLLLYAIGALLIIPASNGADFDLFLFAFFVLACGLGSLETNANPYITKLGQEKDAAFRINVAQSFNGVGQFVGPILGGHLFLSLANGHLEKNMSNVQGVYVGIAFIVLLIMLVFILVKMPQANLKDEEDVHEHICLKKIFSYPHFNFGLLAQFLYVAAQVGAGAFFINYATEHWTELSDEKAAYYLSAALVAFMLGRVFTTPLMKIFSPQKLLAIYSGINVILGAILFMGIPVVSVYVLIGVFFFMSISFPTIFALATKDLHTRHVKFGSSLLVMSIVGGAIMPYLMGKVSDNFGTSYGYLLLVPCFAYVAWYGAFGCKTKT
ncbi:L-fucose:H+ symporter permease [Helicobacter sp. 11S03491-1]|uniref:L-fucose:H+ symporter permease n=1 Tax=Helicobacter sp. 11S03491-1 TaxID=1476196 RepID=UPI000BA78DA8|nr:L-fucose:H+ symporter permease [Helicobacter sp. 11S03491-1]PAF42282.1 L-fucose:H+ symporter permease [Helicobacter sp. 11S03491-1]